MTIPYENADELNDSAEISDDNRAHNIPSVYEEQIKKTIGSIEMIIKDEVVAARRKQR